MTTSPTSFLAEIVDEGCPIPAGKLAYLQERQRNRLYDFIVSKFLQKEKNGFSRADLARRLGKRPEQITRWLSSPGNWTLDTLSDLTLAICGGELNFSVADFSNIQIRNYNQSASLENRIASTKTSSPAIITILTRTNGGGLANAISG